MWSTGGVAFTPTPGVIFTKKYRFLMTYALAYRDTDQMSHDERAWYLAQIDDAVRCCRRAGRWTATCGMSPRVLIRRSTGMGGERAGR